MRTDLTLVPADGTRRDVAVLAPAGTVWADVLAVLGDRWDASAPAWVGRDRVLPTAVLGTPPLVIGAVVSTVRSADQRNGVHLAVLGGQALTPEVPLGGGDLVVGRDPSSDLVLTDPAVSRRHAAFALRGRELVVRDLGSTAGTLVGTEPATVPIVVAAGVMVRVGHTYVGAAVDRDAPPTAVEVVIAAPASAARQPRPRLNLAAALLPGVAGVVLALALHSPVLLLFAALTPVGVLAATGGERWQWRRARRRGVARDRAALAAFERRLVAAVDADADEQHAAHPDPAAVTRIARRRSARLWERTGGRLVVRVGLAELPTRVRVDRGEGAATPALTRTVPLVADLQAGSVAVVAPRAVRESWARAVVAALATAYAPSDLELAVVSAWPERWTWMRWLPHWHGVSTARELAVHTRAAQRRLVAVIDDPRSDDHALARDLAAIVLCSSRSASAKEAGQRIVAHPDGTATARLDGHVTDTLVLDGIDVATADNVARALAPLRRVPDAGGAPPPQCLLVDVLGVDRADPAGDLRARWSRRDGSLRTVLGRDADGNGVEVDLVADGPHALVAGTTGSGKSELLQALVVGLAVQHPPSHVTMLLIDYKGGAAFAECAHLPHTVGLVTDLDDHLTRRVLMSLDTEIARRERVLAARGAHDVADLVDTDDPLPRLVIVVDEFATLAEDLPGFVSGLVSIAQRGRSLGLHLVLATQRPAGVVSAEIRSNTTLRICLRVTDRADSADVIGCDDAASLSRHAPGRGFVRRGADLVAVQVARVGSARHSWRSAAPRVVDLDGWRRLPPTAQQPVPTDLHRLVRAAGEAGQGLPRARRPWADPLPTRLDAAHLPACADDTAVAVGLVDVPRRQRHDALFVRPGETVLVAGAARSGRTTAARTIAASFAAARSPARLQIHAVTASARSLRELLALPHVGTIAGADDGFDFVAGVVARLGRLVAGRLQHVEVTGDVLVLLDGWEQLVAGSDEHDGGRTADLLVDLLRDAPAAGVTVVVTGGRAALTSRLTAHVSTRLLLALPDTADYLLAGIDRAAVPARVPGRGVRAGDSLEFQFALPDREIRPDEPDPTTMRMHPLPARVSLRDLAAPSHGVALGVGGDAAGPIVLDLHRGARRVLVAGPPGSGRSTTLGTLLTGAAGTGVPCIVVATPRSPLAELARSLRVTLCEPDHLVTPPAPGATVFVDDADRLGPAAEAALSGWLHDDPSPTIVLAARSDVLAVTFRGLTADVRAARCGVLLQPGVADGELLGAHLPPGRPSRVPGRGVLVPDPAWGLGSEPVQLQVAGP